MVRLLVKATSNNGQTQGILTNSMKKLTKGLRWPTKPNLSIIFFIDPDDRSIRQSLSGISHPKVYK